MSCSSTCVLQFLGVQHAANYQIYGAIFTFSTDAAAEGRQAGRQTQVYRRKCLKQTKKVLENRAA